MWRGHSIRLGVVDARPTAEILVTGLRFCFRPAEMLRYREYDWALVHGESRIEAHLPRRHGGNPAPIWWMRLQFIAIGPQWRRCGKLDRPHIFIELYNFDVPPGDWRNLSGLNFWNIEYADDEAWLAGPDPGEFRFQYLSSFRENRREEHPAFTEVNWRVVSAEGSLLTIELSADSDSPQPPPASLETVSAIPGLAAAPETAATGHALYLLETVPFGVVSAKVPRNAPDALAYVETLSHRTLKTPAADHMHLRDFKDHKNENIRGDLHVDLHFFGYHGT